MPYHLLLFCLMLLAIAVGTFFTAACLVAKSKIEWAIYLPLGIFCFFLSFYIYTTMQGAGTRLGEYIGAKRIVSFIKKYPKEHSEYRVEKDMISVTYVNPDTGDITRDYTDTSTITVIENQNISVPTYHYVPAEHRLSLYWPYPGREDYDSFHFIRIPAAELEEKLANPD